jgi:hypothetical protein
VVSKPSAKRGVSRGASSKDSEDDQVVGPIPLSSLAKEHRTARYLRGLDKASVAELFEAGNLGEVPSTITRARAQLISVCGLGGGSCSKDQGEVIVIEEKKPARAPENLETGPPAAVAESTANLQLKEQMVSLQNTVDGLIGAMASLVSNMQTQSD